MRITTSMMTNRYVRNLNKSASELNYLNEKVATGRKFFKGSEDSLGAIKAYKLRREYRATEMYSTNISETDSYLTIAETNLNEISSNLELVYTSYLKGITGTMSSGDREIVAKELDNLQDSILASLNAKITDRYVFGGTSKNEIPFTKDAEGNLLYKGINVNDGSSNFDPPITKEEGLEILKELCDETVNIDIGLGMKFDGDDLNKDTVFDLSMAGIKFLGYGTDGSGEDMPNNIYSLIGEIKEQLRDEDFSYEKIQPYIDTFEKQKQNVLVNITDIGSKTKFLEFLKLRNEDNQYSLNERILDVEYMDPAKAIVEFKMQEYSYNAALAMGNKILQNSFIDFMK